jgi:2-amino-4-hydroxy-6-hydroxymethyldihydropteridine diphosphokinase
VDRVAIALGSNLGDRAAHLDFAVERLRTIVRPLMVSRYHETAPHGVTEAQPNYLNAACVGSTALEPRALLEMLLRIEGERGRERPAPSAPRTLDLDLILYGDRVIAEPGLIVPHARFRARAFVLAPLAEVAPDWVDPETGETVRALLEHLRTS